MTVLKLVGTVALGDECRVSYLEDDDGERCLNGAIHIGDTDLVDRVLETKWNGDVTFAFADERWSGGLDGDYGWGYSEYTPMDPDRLFVGEHDIIKILSQHDGKEVTVWFADEPFNTAE